MRWLCHLFLNVLNRLLEKQGLIPRLRDILRLDTVTIPASLAKKGTSNWRAWKTLTLEQDRLFDSVKIVLVFTKDSPTRATKAHQTTGREVHRAS